jgi:hypothetical protein
MHAVAGASLPVAIALLVLVGVARGVLLADGADARAKHLAARSLEPLTVCCLIAVVVNVIALLAGAGAGALSVFLALAVGAGAVLLWASVEPADAGTVKPDAEPDPEPPAVEPERPSSGSLWADPAAEPAPRTTLWSEQ